MVLAEDVYASADIPAFNQSSMDGYAFAFSGWKPGNRLVIVEEIPAGKRESRPLAFGEAARIFTGAALPEGADTVVMQEMVQVEGNQLHIMDANLAEGNHMRLRGSEIRKGELACKRGTPLSPAAIGFLSAIGTAEVAVFPQPTVAIIVTGDELQRPGESLLHGQVYEASSSMLRAALHQMHINDVKTYQVEDSLAAIEKVLAAALAASDIVLLTGGVSVGDYDFVVPATVTCGVQQLFHRVKQRPGKPIFFGRKGNKAVFGLPGNPSSVLTCFYEYTWLILRKWSNRSEGLRVEMASLSADYTKTNMLTHFLKGYHHEGKVDVLGAQESFRLRSFAAANCLVKLGEEMRVYRKEELVEIHLLPSYG